MTEAQRSARERLFGRYGLAFSNSPPDYDLAFGRRAPRVLEIGFGMGETTAEIAAAHPEIDYLALEVHGPGVGSLLRLIEERQLANVRILQHDAVEVVRAMILPQSLSGIHIFFPDPWPKKRHHKRRLVQPPFVALVTSRLVADGYVHCATDWQPYAEQMLEVLAAEPLLVNTSADDASRPAWRPPTKFEARGRAPRHGVWDLLFRKR